MNSITRDEFAHLLSEALIKSRIQRELRFVPEEIIDWSERDFLAVTNRSGSEGVIIAPFEKVYVVPFQLHKRLPGKSGRLEAVICDICATWQRGSNSAIISFQKEKSIVSFLCCQDLLCSLHVRDQTAASKLSRVQLRENNSVVQRIARLHHKLDAILKDVTS